MKRSLFIFFFWALLTTAHAQQAPLPKNFKQALFAEYNSTSTAISFNYERSFATRGTWNFHYRAGLGIKGDGAGLPLGISAVGGNGDHHPELSFLLVPFVQHARYLFKEGNRSDKQLYLIPAAGYRFSKGQSRFFAKAAAGPAIFLDPRSDDFWKMDGTIKLSVSVAAGYKF